MVLHDRLTADESEDVVGLLRALLRTTSVNPPGNEAAVVEILEKRSRDAMRWFRSHRPDAATPAFVVAGGVAANGEIRRALEKMARREGFTLAVPPVKLCTDNAAMIAWAGLERFQSGETAPLDITARARWPLSA